MCCVVCVCVCDYVCVRDYVFVCVVMYVCVFVCEYVRADTCTHDWSVSFVYLFAYACVIRFQFFSVC